MSLASGAAEATLIPGNIVTILDRRRRRASS
jgi:hypothetical protein